MKQHQHESDTATRMRHFELLNEWHHTPEWEAGCYDFDSLVGKRWEITRELYWEFLELLPPLCHDANSFLMSEALSGNIRSKYIREGDRYFHEYARYPERH